MMDKKFNFTTKKRKLFTTVFYMLSFQNREIKNKG